MAKTIEELNFKLKVDDDAFKKQLKADEKAAKDLADTVRDYLNIKKAQGTLSEKEYQTLKRLDNLESNRRINAEKELAAQAKRLAAEERLSQAKEKTNQHQSTHNRLMREAASLAASYVSIWGAKKLLSELVAVTGEFEMQRTTLKAMLQDANGANAIYEQIKQLAVVSPFGFKELVTYTKQLAAYSVPIGELYETTKMLADVSAGLGVGMDRLVLAYGQVRSAAFLRGQEVRQFTEAGIPILDELAKQFGEIEGRLVSVGEVFDKISARQVPFEMVAKVFKEMTSDGGKFYNMQEIQAETLKGKISNLKDAYEIMFSEIGEKVQPAMKGAVDTLRNLMENYEQIGKKLLWMVGVYGAARVATRIFTAETISAGIAQTSLAKGLSAVKSFALKNPYVLLAAGAAALAGGIYSAATAQNAMEKSLSAVSKSVDIFNAANAEDEINLRFLIKQLDSAKKGTQEYEKAKRQLYSEYGTYIGEIDAENIALGKTAEAYQNIALAVRDANREKALSAGLTDISNIYRDEYDNIFKQLRGTLQSLDINPNGAIAKQLGKYIRGEVNVSDLSKEATDVITRVKQSLDAKLKTAGGMFGNGISFYGVDIDALRENLKTAEDIAIDARQSLADALEVIYGPTPKISTSGGNLEGGADDNSSAIEALQKRISLLEKLRDVYESMRPFFSDEQIRDFFATNFSFADKNLWENFDFSEQIDGLVDKLAQLGDKGLDAANVIREKLATALSKDLVNAQNAAAKVADALAEYLKSWSVGDETEGTGAIYKVTKVVSDYQKALDALGDKRGDATEKLDEWIKAEKAAGRTVSDEAKAAKENEIANKYAVASTNLLNKAMNDLQNTAEGLVKEWLAISGIDISNWSNKSTAELKALRKEIENLTDEEVINRLGGSWEQLVSKLGNEKAAEYLGFIREAINSISGDVDETLDDKNLKNLKYAATQLSKLAKELGDVGEAVSDISDVVSSVAQGAKQGGWVGALVSGIITVGAKLLQEVTYAKKLQKVLYETQISARTARWDGILGSSESIFGDSTLTKMRAISQVLSETRASLNGITADLSKQRIKEAWHNSYLNPLGKIEDTVETIVAKLQGGVSTNLLAQEDKAWKAYREALEKGYSGLEAYIVKTIDRSWFANFAGIQDQYKSLKDIFDEVGYSMYDQYGNLNAEGLQAILDTYDKLGEADRKWINDAIAASEEYQEALESLDDVLEGYFGNIAAELVDSMLESFKQTGDAAADLESVFANLGDTIAKAFGQSLLIDVLKEKYYDFIKKASLDYANTGDYQTYLNALTEFKTGLENDLPLLTDSIQGIFETVRDTVGMSESASQNLADGIKGITEDTANLLASYLNAIRADVSYSKVQRDNILAEIKNMASYVASPTLLDYLNRIQANTYDNARATESILSDIRSMMTTDGGFTALRVYQ